ncbi:hypothetical protein V5P93_006500 [Actinokineospora auranticolor]|uniref:Uncharacterized protein n=1 Tax=Actinokineospora auranticolor TaxID=155976 RepID=A0A2S6GXG7_9PSEU|nr:hypothetical protein [Actinokineospora auranticolor]PPK69860.1 hypothetical protein CLV40_103470 [Actinokineospora auranticolor]
MDDIEIPAAREVPDVVRARVHVQVFRQIQEPPKRRYALPVAAGVVAAALAVGLVAVVGSDSGTTPASGKRETAQPAAPSEADAANADLDRCWSGLRGTPFAGQLPPRERVVPVLRVSQLQVNVVAARVDGKPIFCETTPKGVRLSKLDAQPSMVTGTGTGTLLVSPNGTIAGVLDPTWADPYLSVTSRSKNTIREAVKHKDGLFIFRSALSTINSTITVQPTPDGLALPVPYPPDPGFSITSQARYPSPELTECARKATDSTTVVDSDSWDAAATVRAGGDRIILATNSGGVAACVEQQSYTDFYAMPEPERRPMLLGIIPSIGGKPLLTGVIPLGGRSAELILPGGGTIQANTARGTYAALLESNIDPRAMTLRVRDNSEKVIYEGPLT